MTEKSKTWNELRWLPKTDLSGESLSVAMLRMELTLREDAQGVADS